MKTFLQLFFITSFLASLLLYLLTKNAEPPRPSEDKAKAWAKGENIFIERFEQGEPRLEFFARNLVAALLVELIGNVQLKTAKNGKSTIASSDYASFELPNIPSFSRPSQKEDVFVKEILLKDNVVLRDGLHKVYTAGAKIDLVGNLVSGQLPVKFERPGYELSSEGGFTYDYKGGDISLFTKTRGRAYPIP